jgi:enamine deaminase RidA (YjgF/YER057c/UK114 family)
MPSTIAPPAAAYAHAVLSADAQRWLHTSGVVPVSPDGTVPDSLHEQAEVVWANIGAMLEDADMTARHIVSVTTYVLPGRDLGAVMAARDRFMGGHLAASTLVIVPELAQPAWQVEISVVAAA